MHEKYVKIIRIERMWKDDKKENAASLHMPVDYWLMSCGICYFSAKDTAGSCYTTEIQ